MDKRKKLRDVIKHIWQKHRAEMLTPTLQLVLLAYPLAGTSKAKTLEYGVHVAVRYFKQSKDYVLDFFRQYHIDLADGESFSEKEIESAENGAVVLIHEYFKDIYVANKWIGDEYKFEEKFISAQDARTFLNVDKKDFEEYTADFECVPYRLADGNVAYDFDDIFRIWEILNEENALPSLTGDAEIDKKVLYTLDVFNIGG